MISNVRLLLIVQAAVFVIAALTHAGVLAAGYEHRQAATAESVIAAVLLLGLVVSWFRPATTRAAGLVAQGFALLGTIVGVIMVAIGVGPRTPLDVVYHLGMIVLLVVGLFVTARSEAPLRERA
jgi:hypothetical protein